MAEIPIAVVGNVATSVQGKLTSAGRVASFRLASNVRRFDRTRGIWYDAETNYFTVTCWRQLADNVLSSLSKGDPVVVSGGSTSGHGRTPSARASQSRSSRRGRP
jgi:single-strand DNA-binding protein